MSLRLAARRLAPSAGSHCSLTSTHGSPSILLQGNQTSTPQRRHKWTDNLWGRLRGTTANDKVASDLDDPKKRKDFVKENSLVANNTKGSIFEDEIEASSENNAVQEAQLAQPKTKQQMAIALDPNPRSRIRWQRKKIIQMVRNNGAVTRDERIRMTEREMLHKSEFLPTSLKKLVMLSRQIAGKPIDEAITQMQWSKKKISAEIRYYLQEARDLAVAQNGMGLGSVKGELLSTPRKIQDKDGKWLEITDPTRIYIAQSWIGRGPLRGKQLDYKGRGRTGIIKHPSTSFSVVLKEEKTRIREHDERQAKKVKQGPWVHLPNKKVYGQRPYYSW